MSKFMKSLCKIAIPVTLQSMLQASFSIVDQIMIGQLGETNISAVGLCGNFSLIFSKADIRMVFTTGKTAQRWFERFSDRQSICLPSPSPANRRVSWEELLKAYRRLLDYLE